MWFRLIYRSVDGDQLPIQIPPIGRSQSGKWPDNYQCGSATSLVNHAAGVCQNIEDHHDSRCAQRSNSKYPFESADPIGAVRAAHGHPIQLSRSSPPLQFLKMLQDRFTSVKALGSPGLSSQVGQSLFNLIW